MMRGSLAFALLLSGVTGFAPSSVGTKSSRVTSLSASRQDDGDSRREFFSRSVGIAAAGLGVPFLPLESANAVSGVSKVNAKLKGFGLPVVSEVQNGFSPLLEVYGKGRNRFPILVQFNYPLTWVVTVPSNDQNGEDGTVQAGEYAKGDTATFFVYDEPGSVSDVNSQSKSFFEKAIIKAISQKGDNMYQSFKVIKTEPTERDGQQYTLVDFKYELLTGAGFTVDRRGVASVTSQGKAVEVLWTATISQRYKKMEDTLRYIAGSFRCYTDGLNLSDELYVGYGELS
ncbi:expressed unknown protein [Seminavis robusta]|uniref:PsbP C-terminal domain-containing protein n=1 Tax=Seminavis robusta TaxID=568900 RepID=A0A9N8D7H9_9STRA|nr:expressed unknown protein [Seminavis robusta]|eukprot:Sro26_g017820.1 n/a (286) ;mRNA; f:130791-131921